MGYTVRWFDPTQLQWKRHVKDVNLDVCGKITAGVPAQQFSPLITCVLLTNNKNKTTKTCCFNLLFQPVVSTCCFNLSLFLFIMATQQQHEQQKQREQLRKQQREQQREHLMVLDKTTTATKTSILFDVASSTDGKFQPVVSTCCFNLLFQPVVSTCCFNLLFQPVVSTFLFFFSSFQPAVSISCFNLLFQLLVSTCCFFAVWRARGRKDGIRGRHALPLLGPFGFVWSWTRPTK